MKLHLFLVVLALSLGLAASTKAQDAKALLLFGGEDHKTFLGCLNCSSLSATSVCNSLGKFGSSLASDSIWNSLGKFGSSLSQYSPWNSLTNNAPIIVDSDGNSYGYLGVNTLHHNRTHIGWLVAILDFEDEKDDLDETRDKMCDD
jgi:hypothetical protein